MPTFSKFFSMEIHNFDSFGTPRIEDLNRPKKLEQKISIPSRGKLFFFQILSRLTDFLFLFFIVLPFLKSLRIQNLLGSHPASRDLKSSVWKLIYFCLEWKKITALSIF